MDSMGEGEGGKIWIIFYTAVSNAVHIRPPKGELLKPRELFFPSMNVCNYIDLKISYTTEPLLSTIYKSTNS